MSRSETSSGDVNSISLDHIPSMIMEYPRRIVLGLCMILRRRQIAQGNHERVLKSDTTAKRRTNKAACRALLETSFGLSKKVSTSQRIVTEDGSLGTEKRGLSRGHMCRQVSEMGTTKLAKADHRSQPRRRAGGMTMRQLWKSVVLVFFHLLILVDLCSGCGPGRGAGRRRAPRKLTPLVYKQHVPNVPENTLSASGLNEGKINRDHPRFKALVPNYNSDIIFRDDEGTGADRLMTQRCKEKLNTLAISVMNQWPGVRLRVIEGWDEGNHHSTSSLHYEGRAVDITTSDKDRSKYGMLARLAVEAGFDWVYYESRAHIHCSVKSDSSQAARTGGCFSSNATVNTPEGSKKIAYVKPGDSIQSMNEEGKPIFSEVLMFLDKNASETREFYHVTTSSGASMALTPSHLMFKVDRIVGESIAKISDELSDVEAKEVYSSARVTFAKHIEAGDWLLVVKNSQKVSLERVVHMEAEMSTGVYAPLTKQGNVVVDGILASCYAVIDDQDLAHLAFSPVRLVVNMYEGFVHAWKQFSNFITFHQPFHSKSALSNSISSNSNDSLNNIQPSAANWRNSHSAEVEQGVHWYASFLYSTTKHLLPSNLLYDHE